MALYYKQSGAWVEIPDGQVDFKQGGAWGDAQAIYHKSAGSWTQVWPPQTQTGPSYPLMIDGAEDGDMAEYIAVSETNYAAASSPVASGSFAIVNQSTGGEYTTSFAGLPFYPRRGDTIQYRAYLPSGSTRHQVDLLSWGDNLVSDGYVSTNRYRLRLDLSTGQVLLDRNGGSNETIIDTTAALPAGEYLTIEVTAGLDYTWALTIDDESGTELLNTSASESSSGAWPSGGLGFYSADANNAWDDIQLTDRAQPTTEFAEIGRSAMTYINEPQGIYSAADDTTYIAIQGPNLDPYAYAYDHATGEWEGPVRIGDNPLTDDTHGPPAIEQDDNGTLHVFWGSHGEVGPDQQYAQSTNPSDISAWTQQSALVPQNAGYTYPYPIWLAGRNELIVLLRDQELGGGGATESNTFTIATSTDRGGSWSYNHDAIDPGTGYSIYHRDTRLNSDGTIDIAFALLDRGSANFEGPYHVVYNPSTQEFSSYDGTSFGSTATYSEVDSNARVAQVSQPEPIYPNLTRDGNGDPAICYALDDGSTRTLTYRGWTGSDYGTAETVFSGLGVKGLLKFESGVPTIVAANDTASLGVSTPTGSVSVEKWDRSGGTWSKAETWWEQEDYIVPSADSWKYPFVNRVRNADPELEYFWSEAYGGDFDQPVRAWARGANGYVDKY